MKSSSSQSRDLIVLGPKMVPTKGSPRDKDKLSGSSLTGINCQEKFDATVAAKLERGTCKVL